jgi:hypothetical protein
MPETTRLAQVTDLTNTVRHLTATRRAVAAGCTHLPDRLFTWWAYNWRTDKNDILCAACCDCGQVLAGAAEDAEEGGGASPYQALAYGDAGVPAKPAD